MKLYYLVNNKNGQKYFSSKYKAFSSERGALMSFLSFYRDRGKMNKSDIKIFEGIPKSTKPYSQTTFEEIKDIVKNYFDIVSVTI